MARVIVEMSVSLDGFIAREDGRTDEVHRWYFRGDTEVAMPNSELVFATDRASAELIREQFEMIGANVTGRRTFDDAQAWGGRDPYGLPSFIVSHSVPEEWSRADSPFTFVTEGVAAAIAKAKAAAGERDVAVAAASIAQQCLALGLLDEIQLHVAPVLLGEGIRLFNGLGPVRLEPQRVIEAPTVTHLYYRVVR
jgi:dihydrofolate reductase